MKRLFKVKDLFFDLKSSAKIYRNEQGGPAAGVFIRLGPDHIGKHGNTPKQAKRNKTCN